MTEQPTEGARAAYNTVSKKIMADIFRANSGQPTQHDVAEMQADIDRDAVAPAVRELSELVQSYINQTSDVGTAFSLNEKARHTLERYRHLLETE